MHYTHAAMEARRGCQMPWNWSHSSCRHRVDAGTKPGSSARAPDTCFCFGSSLLSFVCLFVLNRFFKAGCRFFPVFLLDYHLHTVLRAHPPSYITNIRLLFNFGKVGLPFPSGPRFGLGKEERFYSK